MATYFQGSYLPAYKEFTPDYQFLASALQTRQAKYEAGHKALSDAYGKVVYGDLSRKDSNEIRDYYANDLSKQLEKAAQSDLSLGQNVETAKNLFKPFYENDLIVKDLAFTKKYKQLMSDAEYFKSATDPKVKDKYWTTGVEAMKFQMEDFLNADKEKAVNMSMPSYVENPNLFKKVSEYFKDYKIDVKRDLIDPSNPYYVITAENGEQIKGDLYSLAQQVFMNDPNIQQAYYTDAYVKSRKFAKSAVESGMFNSEDEAKEAWATETISRMKEYQEAMLSKNKEALEKIKAINVNWQNYERSNELTEEQVQTKSTIEDRYQETIRRLNNNTEQLNNPVPEEELDSPSKLNRAYNLLVNYNLQNELFKASDLYSKLHSNTSFEADVYMLEKVKYQNELKLIAAREDSAKRVEAFKQGLDGKKENPLNNLLSLTPSLNKKGTTSVEFDDDGKPILEDVNVIQNNAQNFANLYDENLNEKLTSAISIHEQLFKSDNNTYNIQGLTGTLSQIKKELLKPENKEKLLKFFEETKNNTNRVNEINPSIASDPNKLKSFINLTGTFNKDDRNSINLGQQYDQASKLYYDNYKKALKLKLPGTEKLIQLQKDIDLTGQDTYFKDVNGIKVLKTEQDFEKEILEIYPVNMQKVIQPGPFGNNPVLVDINKDTREEFIKIRNTIENVINKTLDGSYNTILQSENEEYQGKTVFNTFNYKEAARGIEPENMQSQGGFVNPYYAVTLPIASEYVNNEDAQIMVESLLKQLDISQRDGVFYAGDIGLSDSKEESQDDVRNMIATALNLYAQQTSSNDKKSPILNIGYANAYSSGDDISGGQGAYVVTFSNDFLKEYDIKAKSNTYTFSFPSNSDVNPLNAPEYNMSSIEYLVNNSPNNIYEESVLNGGKVKVYKNANDQFIMDVVAEQYNKNKISYVEFPSINLSAEYKNSENFDKLFSEMIRKLQVISQSNTKK